MSDPRDKLQATFQPTKRFATYGEALLQLHIKGFRTHVDTLIRIESPITAFCGVNGTGKSTVLQLAAAAYQKTSASRYFVSSFIIAGTLDIRPFTESASVAFNYVEPPTTGGTNPERTLTLSRSGSSWSGYDRQPARFVLYLGSGFYIPLSERDSEFKSLMEDRTFRARTSDRLNSDILARISSILLCDYDAAHKNAMRKKYARRHTRLLSANRTNGPTYSEANMGSGEARLYNLVMHIEGVPEKSLVLIEEPEIALHPSAQYELGKYLVDAAMRRGIQIMLTTHSEYLMLPLPQKSRIFLKREPNGITPISGIGVRQAVSMMDALAVPSLYVVVEDDVAEAIVNELLRMHDVDFHKTVRVLIGGDKNQIRQLMGVFKEQRMPICAVRDGDAGADTAIKVFKLFGKDAPEKEMFNSVSFKKCCIDDLKVDWDAVVVKNKMAANHHEWFDPIVTESARKRADLLPILAKAYLAGVPESDRRALVEQIRASC